MDRISPGYTVHIERVSYRLFWWKGGEKFVGHCHSVMHEYETIQIFKF